MPLVDFANLAQLLNGVRLLAYVSNLQKRFTETRLEDVDLFKTQPLQELCLYGPRKSKPESEVWTTQTAINCDTFWLQSFRTRNHDSLVNTKILCYCTVIALFFIVFSIVFNHCIPNTSPRGLHLEVHLTESFFRYEFGVLIFGGACFRNFTVPNVLHSDCKKYLRFSPCF